MKKKMKSCVKEIWKINKNGKKKKIHGSLNTLAFPKAERKSKSRTRFTRFFILTFFLTPFFLWRKHKMKEMKKKYMRRMTLWASYYFLGLGDDFFYFLFEGVNVFLLLNNIFFSFFFSKSMMATIAASNIRWNMSGDKQAIFKNICSDFQIE